MASDDAAEILLACNGAPTHVVRLGRGWSYLEEENSETYRWTAPEFEIRLAAAAECLVVEYARPEFFGTADCLVTGPEGSLEIAVPPGRVTLQIDIERILRASGSLFLSLSKTGRAPPDPREFGLCVYRVEALHGVAANRARRDKADIELPTMVRHLPTELSIAATDRCNLRCVMCGSHHSQTGDNNAGKEDLGESLIRKIGPLAASADSVQLHGGAGEPLFNPQFWTLANGFSRIEGRNIEIHTNGLLFNERNIALLMNSAISHVSLSFDAASEAIYRKVRGGSFEKLVANVENLVAARRHSGRDDLRLTANMTVFQANAHEAAGLVELAHRLGLDAVMLMHMNAGNAYNWTETKDDGWVFDYRSNLPDADPGHIRQCVDAAIATAAGLNYQLMVDPRLAVIDAPCDELAPVTEAPAAAAAPVTVAESRLRYGECRTPWHWLNVAANGDVSPCCWSRRPLGNLNEVESLGDIWNGRKLRELRHNIRENRLDREICEGASCIYVTAGHADG